MLTPIKRSPKPLAGWAECQKHKAQAQEAEELCAKHKIYPATTEYCYGYDGDNYDVAMPNWFDIAKLIEIIRAEKQ